MCNNNSRLKLKLVIFTIYLIHLNCMKTKHRSLTQRFTTDRNFSKTTKFTYLKIWNGFSMNSNVLDV